MIIYNFQQLNSFECEKNLSIKYQSKKMYIHKYVVKNCQQDLKYSLIPAQGFSLDVVFNFVLNSLPNSSSFVLNFSVFFFNVYFDLCSFLNFNFRIFLFDLLFALVDFFGVRLTDGSLRKIQSLTDRV